MVSRLRRRGSGEVEVSIAVTNPTLLVFLFHCATKGPFYLWAKTVGCAIVDYSYAVPRRPNVLAEWGFKSDQEVKQSEEDIAVSLYFPRSVLPLDVDNIPSEQNACGCIEVKKDASLDLSKTDTTVPIIINFHGGGMILGGALDSAGLGLVQKLAEIMPDKKPFIIASVDYRLAPEHPFPAAPMDALTIVDHFVKTFPSHKIHIMGISAGANVAAVATLEAVRKYPGRISSSEYPSFFLALRYCNGACCAILVHHTLHSPLRRSSFTCRFAMCTHAGPGCQFSQLPPQLNEFPQLSH